MTKKLEELLDLPEVKEAISKAEHDEISDDNTDVETTDLALDPTDMKSIDKKLDKIEAALPQVDGLDTVGVEMDDIAKKAMDHFV